MLHYGMRLISLGSAPLSGQELRYAAELIFRAGSIPCGSNFCRPCRIIRIPDGGRLWVLDAALNNEVASHAITALTSYVLSIIPSRPGPIPEACSSIVQGAEKHQIISAFNKLHHRLESLPCYETHEGLLNATLTLNNIVAVLCAEKVKAKSGGWRVHLEPALSLLNHILDGSPQLHGSRWSGLLGLIDGSTLRDAHRAAFCFSVATLVADDILASTALGRPPALTNHLSDLLAPDNHVVSGNGLRLDNFMGCQNWVMRSIGDISSLAACKKQMLKGHLSSSTDLTQRGYTIEIYLKHHMPQVTASYKGGNGCFESLDMFASREKDEASSKVTLIWAHAALLYLHTVLLGWEPQHPNIKEAVVELRKQLMDISRKPVILHTLAWPIMLGESLATEIQDPVFQTLFKSLGPLTGLGSMSTARDIIMVMHQQAPALNEWDVAACLNSLGYPALLY